MRRISPFGAAIAALAISLAPAALAQTTTTEQQKDPNVPADRVESPDSSPSAAQNDPSRGANDPARIGTDTRSNQDANNNRNPSMKTDTGTVTQTQTTQTTTSPSTTYESTAPPATTSTTTTNDTTSNTTTYDNTTTNRPATLPRTASRVPLAGLLGLSALGAALVVRSRRLLR